MRCLHSVHASVILTLTFGTSYFLALVGIIASLSRGIADFNGANSVLQNIFLHKKIAPHSRYLHFTTNGLICQVFFCISHKINVLTQPLAAEHAVLCTVDKQIRCIFGKIARTGNFEFRIILRGLRPFRRGRDALPCGGEGRASARSYTEA